ncbi:serine hydrolase domain-containing protein [Sphingosinithalassobacter portus]|uniref:serine hydrolase domain-containing protein n=1 Tax=Stakelama portus TaxID=2676234 RepID=UPI000D6E2B35|nr:serine hydrolase [Sphingosinithalassobacter portus]
MRSSFSADRRVVITGICATALLSSACTRGMPQGSAARIWDWPLADPSAVGLDATKLDAAAKQLAAAGERQGLVIVRDGHLVFERYWANAYHRAEPGWQNVSFSAGKSWGSTMVGRAVTQGHLSVDDLARRYVPAAQTGLHPETRIRHLLTMSSGGTLVTKPSSKPPRRLNDDTPPGPAEEYSRSEGHSRERGAPDGYGVSLAPGSIFFYDGGAADHLAEIVSAAVGVPSYDYMMREIIAPLGCRHTDYQPQGIDSNRDVRIGGSMLISCRDLARLGRLYLEGGVWNGERLIYADYIAAATAPSARNPDYGYLWILNTSGRISQAPRSMYFAAGARGQFCFVLPEQRIIVATMGFGREQLGWGEAWDVLGPALLT